MIRSLSFLSPGNFPDDAVRVVAPALGWRPGRGRWPSDRA